jgi:hypothetical protein
MVRGENVWPFADLKAVEVIPVVEQAALELRWLSAQQHLRPDEKLKLLTGYYYRANSLQRECLVELLMLNFCNMALAPADIPNAEQVS